MNLKIFLIIFVMIFKMLRYSLLDSFMPNNAYSYYSGVRNKRGGGNKRGGVHILLKLINGGSGINGVVCTIFSTQNKWGLEYTGWCTQSFPPSTNGVWNKRGGGEHNFFHSIGHQNFSSKKRDHGH